MSDREAQKRAAAERAVSYVESGMKLGLGTGWFGARGQVSPDGSRLLAVQGQDPRGFRLAVRARTRGLTAADVDRALTDDRSLVVTWLNRGTLHLVRSEDYPWLHALTAPPQATGIARRLGPWNPSHPMTKRASMRCSVPPLR